MIVVEFPKRNVNRPEYDRATMLAEMLKLATEGVGKPENHITDKEVEALVAAIGAVTNQEAEDLMQLVHKCFRTILEAAAAGRRPDGK